MKFIILCFLFLGCGENIYIPPKEEIAKKLIKRSDIIKIGACEYIFYRSASRSALAHKGDCSNSFHKNRVFNNDL